MQVESAEGRIREVKQGKVTFSCLNPGIGDKRHREKEPYVPPTSDSSWIHKNASHVLIALLQKIKENSPILEGDSASCLVLQRLWKMCFKVFLIIVVNIANSYRN